MKPPRRLRGRLAALAALPVNYDPDALDLDHPPAGWSVDDACQPLLGEAPGDPVPGGPWEIAVRLIGGYEFADPSLVHAYYDRETPLLGRDMLLGLRALGLVTVYVGVRVSVVWDETRSCEGRSARVFGWAYRTLQGHVEQGQMDWQVWKWRDSGAVEFRSHAVSRTAPISNPIVRIGFALLKNHERQLYLESTRRRMRELTERALHEQAPADAVRDAGRALTARRARAAGPAHAALAAEFERDSD